MWKTILSVGSLLLLAGCYQQSADSFETINSSSVIEVTATQIGVEPGTDTTPIVIVPDGASTVSPDELVIIQVTTDALPSSSDLATPAPIELGPPLTPTVIIIRPDPETATPNPADLGGLLPTSSPPAFITPEVPSQLVIATATQVGQPLVADPPTNGIQTPTQLPIGVVSGCEYTIVSGDTLFRIALRNNITLASLLSANSLSENSIIQPGQVIQIPGCNTTPTATPASAIAPVGPNSVPATLQSGAGPAAPGAPVGAINQTVHVVRSGETLSGIAARYGVTVQAIININNLTNPDRLSLGQELIIPGG